MQKQSSASHRTPVSPSFQTKAAIELFTPLTRLVLAVLGGLALFVLLLLVMLGTPRAHSAQAAPPSRPLADTTTGVITVQHSADTTHQMVVFGNGRITDWYLNDNGRNQIDQDGDNTDATTIAILFGDLDDTVDVGSQGDFYTKTLVALNDPSSIAGYSEDSYVVYASKVLSYQITQRTLTTDTIHNDWLVMELVINNTGDVSLTGGKLLYMVDIDAAEHRVGDAGNYDPDRRLVYQTDENIGHTEGYAMGISLLGGELRGYGVNGDSYPDSDTDIINEMITPTNDIINTPGDPDNLVSWLVADIPPLPSGQEARLAFGLCAKTGRDEDEARDNLINCFDDLITSHLAFTLAKQASGGPLISGAPLTYTISVTNSSSVVDATNVVVTDPLPDGANYITGGVRSGNVVSWAIPSIRADSDEQVTFVVSTCQQSLVNDSYRVITSTQGVDSPSGPLLESDLAPPAIGADFDYSPSDITVGDTVYFTDASTTNGGPIVTRTWDFGDNSPLATGQASDHRYDTPGTYSAELSIADACGFTATETKPIQVNPRVRKIYFPVIFKYLPPCHVETFDNPSSGWDEKQPPPTLLEYLNGEYHMFTHDTSVLHWAKSPLGPYSDYSVQVDANWVNTAYIGEEYGIVFDLSESNGLLMMYRFNVNTEAGSYVLGKLEGLSWTTLISDTSSAIRGETLTNTLRVEHNGPNIVLYINGQHQKSYTDSDPLPHPGSVGVNILPYDRVDGDGEAYFDNFVICSPELGGSTSSLEGGPTSGVAERP